MVPLHNVAWQGRYTRCPSKRLRMIANMRTFNLSVQETYNVLALLSSRTRWTKKVTDTQHQFKLSMFRIDCINLRKEFPNRAYSWSHR